MDDDIMNINIDDIFRPTNNDFIDISLDEQNPLLLPLPLDHFASVNNPNVNTAFDFNFDLNQANIETCENSQNDLLIHHQDSPEPVVPPNSVNSSVSASDIITGDLSGDDQSRTSGAATGNMRLSARRRPEKDSPEWDEIREKNRLAARKHVQKKKSLDEANQKRLSELAAENNELFEKIDRVQSNIKILQKVLQNILSPQP